MTTEHWQILKKRIIKEMIKVNEAEEFKGTVTSEALLAAFSRVLRIMEELEEK